MTPYELNLCISDYNEKQKVLNDEKVTLTYLGAYWQRIKKLPRLEKILGKEQPKKQMTPEEMFNVVKKLNGAFGGSTVKR
jgi:hypothetical protein